MLHYPIQPATIATNATLAAYPTLFRGLVHAWSAAIASMPRDLRGVQHGTFQNATYIRAKGRECWDFDGTGDYIDFGEKVLPQNGMSLCVVHNPDAVTSQMLVTLYQNDDSEAALQFYVSNPGRCKFRVHQVIDSQRIGRATANNVVVAGQWHCQLGVWNGGTSNSDIEIDLNGVRVDNSDDGNGSFTGPYANPVELWNGAQEFSGPDAEYNGQIAEVLMWDRPLNAWERRLVYELYLKGPGEWARRKPMLVAPPPTGAAPAAAQRLVDGYLVDGLLVDGGLTS